MFIMQAGAQSPFWIWFDRGGTLFSYVALGTVIAAGFQLWQSARRQERRRMRAEALVSGHGARRVALVISPSGGSMEADVERYLTREFPGSHFLHLPIGADVLDPEARRWSIVGFEHAETLTPDGVEAELARLRGVERWLKEVGFDEVHLFMRTSVAYGAAVGCIFTNWGAVHVYHWNHSQRTYEYWFALGEVKRMNPPTALGDAVAAVVSQRLRRHAAPAEAPAVSATPGPHAPDAGDA